MNSMHSYSWFVPVGGFAGLVIGVILAVAFFNKYSAWEQQIYPSISVSADPATELLGFDYQSQFLYVRSRSQEIYLCHVAWPGDTTTTACIKTDPSSATRLGNDPSPCKWLTFPTPQPPGPILSSLEAHPCSGDDGNIQINYIILTDNSIWRSLQSSGGAGEGLAIFFTLVAAVVGAVLGLLIGFVSSRIARRHSMP